MMTTLSRPMRMIATALALALIHGAFAPQAWAQIASIGAVNVPVGGSAAAAASVNASAASFNSAAPMMTLPNGGLAGSFSAPSIALGSPAQASALTAAAVAPSAAGRSVVASVIASVDSARAAAPAALTAISLASPSKDGPKNVTRVSAAKAEANESITFQAGLRTGLIAKKAAEIISSVRAAFGGKSAETLPSAPEALVAGKLSAAHATAGLEPSTPGEFSARTQAIAENEPPAPPKASEKKASKGKGWFGLGATVAALIGGMLVMQVGLEAQGAAMAQLTEDSFGDFSILAQVAIFASIGSMIGQQLGQFFSAKFGLTKTFYAAHVLRAISLGAMVFLLGTGMMPLSLMFVFYAFNGVVTGVALTTEGTLRKFLLAQQGVSQQKFRTWWQLLAEIVAVPAPMILGALALSVGAGWITALYPATIILSLMLFLMLKVIPLGSAKRIENMVADAAKAAAPAAAPEASTAPDAPKIGAWQKIKNAFAKIFTNMEEGKDFVFKNAVLKYSLAGGMIFSLLNVIIYRLIAPGYGKLVAGAAGMSEVQGNLTGMFSLGGLLLAATFLILEWRAKRKTAAKQAAADRAAAELEAAVVADSKYRTVVAGSKKRAYELAIKREAAKSAAELAALKPTPEEIAAAERSSMLRWTLLGIPALGLLAVMAFNLVLPFAAVMFMGVNWVPGTVLAAALIPFGFIQVAASIKLDSYFQDRLPSDSAKVQKALAFSGSAMTAVSIVLMLALKPLFGDIASFNPFPYLAAALIPLGAAIFFIYRKLANATKPENLKLAADLPGEKTAGGFVGILLGVIAAALLLSFMGLIPGVSGLLAGLGVLGRFALHLSVALAIPVAGWFADRAIRKGMLTKIKNAITKSFIGRATKSVIAKIFAKKK